jgi:lactate dehydrogenase-like 2-hydroxyacid dehydrogenase
MATGVDNIDLAAATARGVIVTRTPGVLSGTTADFTFALMLAAARRLAEGERMVREGRWRTWGPEVLLGRDVHGATLGIVGMGGIGREVARRAQAFAMRILYTSRSRKPDVEAECGARFVALDELLRESDFVTLHAPLTEETWRLIGEQELRMMKPTAFLINTARGGLVDPAALERALREGWIAGAALDVTEPEPLPAGHPLLSAPNLIVTPHIASASVATRSRMAMLAGEQLVQALSGGTPAYVANPEVLGRLR